ncbi:glycosyltransferase family 2 protein [Pedobacter boryungensis]|uniref:Glycosyltransferase n=1 Tax=Pedobacter boryungensis TaxID=869962 RepID=A0ABX2DF13_9SPHI|nr:glycosyltransferase [Pedobacter boryungensis]NQX31729.1 glycosyltransferase [Pedobacter boryungensis]
MKETRIEVTVLMPVFNSELYLRNSISSILNQSFTNFELIIINDGSTDESDNIIRSFNDSRINYVNNPSNKGIVAVLNEGLNLSNGKYIARMDADDIATPHRLKIQLQFLKANPEYKLCGTYALKMNEYGEKSSKIRPPKQYANIKVSQLFKNSFIHPSVMADASIIKSFGYKEEYKYAEDYFLFSEIIMHHKAINIADIGLYYRVHNESISATRISEMSLSERKTMQYLLSFLFDEVTEKRLIIHHSLLRPEQNDGVSIDQIEQHLLAIKQANQSKNIYVKNVLEKRLQKEWFNALIRSSENNKLLKFTSSNLFSLRFFNLKQFIKLYSN